jgi:hypothetical protein
MFRNPSVLAKRERMKGCSASIPIDSPCIAGKEAEVWDIPSIKCPGYHGQRKWKRGERRACGHQATLGSLHPRWGRKMGLSVSVASSKNFCKFVHLNILQGLKI